MTTLTVELLHVSEHCHASKWQICDSVRFCRNRADPQILDFEGCPKQQNRWFSFKTITLPLPNMTHFFHTGIGTTLSSASVTQSRLAKKSTIKENTSFFNKI